MLAGLLPVLALAYMLRGRPRRVIVSSVIAFRALRARQGRRRLAKVHLDWTFFVEALILSLAALAAAEPYVVRPRKSVAVVLDNSGVMQVLMPSGISAFEAAKMRLVSYFAGSSDHITLYLTAPRPHRWESPLNGQSGIEAVLNKLKPVDAAEDLAAVSELLTDLVNSDRYDQIVVASRHELNPVLPGRVVGLTVGGPVSNYALGSFTVWRPSLTSPTVEARVTVANFSTSKAELKLTIDDARNSIAEKSLELVPNTVETVEFPNLPAAPLFRATLAPSDRFPLDNTAYAVVGSSSVVKILFVSPFEEHAAGLRELPGVRLLTESPEKYSPADASSVDLAIFDYTAPKEWPACNSLLVMPPGSTPPFDFDVMPASPIAFLTWVAPDPLTDGVNFRLLKPRQGEFFAPHPWMRSVASGLQGSLILAGEREGRRYVALGFEAFPYLGKANLPMSVLTLNILSYLSGSFSVSAGFRAGLPWRVPSGIHQIILPSGKTITTRPGDLFTETYEQGVYRLVGPNNEELRAVNFDNLAESNLLVATPIEFNVARKTFSSSARTDKRPLAGALIVLALALAALEAIFNYLARRPAVVDAGGE